MTASANRAWMLWAAGTVAVVSAILYGFWRYEPEPVDTLGPADRWTADWRAARACLLGDDPPAATARDAVAIREVWLADPTRDLGRCSSALQAATFDLAETTGSVELDAAWDDVSKGVRAALEQLRQRVRRGHPVPNLGPAIDDVDRAYSRLRAAAGLAAAPLAAGPDLPRYPEGNVLRVAPDASSAGPVLPRRVEVRGDRVVAWHHAGARSRRLVFRDDALIADDPVSKLLVAAGDPTWAVTARDVDSSTLGGLEIAAVDADGEPADAGRAPAAARPAASATLQARFAVGDGALRAVLYRLVEERAAAGLEPEATGDDSPPPDGAAEADIFNPAMIESAVVIASGNRGKSWGKAFSLEGGDHEMDVAETEGRADLWWTSEGLGTAWLRLDRDSLPVFVAAATGAAGVAPLEWKTIGDLRSKARAACFSNSAAWWLQEPASRDGEAVGVGEAARDGETAGGGNAAGGDETAGDRKAAGDGGAAGVTGEAGTEAGGTGPFLFRLTAGPSASPDRVAAPAVAAGPVDVHCSDDALVVRSNGGDGYACTIDGCTAWSSAAPTSSVDVVSMTAAGPVSVFSVADLVFVHRAGDERPRPLFRKQLKAEAVGVVSWDGALYVVLHDVDRVRLVPLSPAL